MSWRSTVRSAYRVGKHIVDVFQSEERWFAALDGVLLAGWHITMAGAWAAGVREVDRLDRPFEIRPRTIGEAA